MAVMHLIYVAHREQLPGSAPGSPASSAGSSMTSPRERAFTCVSACHRCYGICLPPLYDAWCYAKTCELLRLLQTAAKQPLSLRAEPRDHGPVVHAVNLHLSNASSCLGH